MIFMPTGLAGLAQSLGSKLAGRPGREAQPGFRTTTSGDMGVAKGNK
jgi:hypothetical protein